MASMNDIVIRVHVSLLDADPPIWRRLEVPASFTLKKLHDAIQRAIGWDDGHLHEFEAGDVIYGEPVPDEESYGRRVTSETRIKLWTLVEREQRVLTYTYDFGDNWRCAVVLEAASAVLDGVVYPRLTEGARAGPPDDVGGIWGYYRFLDVLADPEHEEHADLVEWSGGGFDPEQFDIAALNVELARLAPRKKAPPRKRGTSRG